MERYAKFGVSNLCGYVPQTRRLGEITKTNQRRYIPNGWRKCNFNNQVLDRWHLNSCRVPIRTCNYTTSSIWTERSICTRRCHREHTKPSGITRQLRISMSNHCWRHLLDFQKRLVSLTNGIWGGGRLPLCLLKCLTNGQRCSIL